ncbi:ArsR/SmtB family transcription factor [Methylobacterium adhaesivum]|uniref:Metalloregulator ArsR/SmtB family transcription factor n=1 Tax=Methylobacterium adhaesivum TaxID=333297 RepID=A0ABT8BPN5_9HYPH|nr:metalloregulator ArsR/SmtB family transcription factor [Methylobacterium adhaesivum]MDN3593154.1 metalloregulator ArsR/SmtB family transcription factor [Methylobacterium adhaesivum]
MINHMVEHLPLALDSVFHALADRTRRAMVDQLASGERTVSELAAPYAMSLAAASKHVRVLEDAGLLSRTVEGRVHRCALERRPLMQALSWLRTYTDFWDQRLDALEDLLNTEDDDDRH